MMDDTMTNRDTTTNSEQLLDKFFSEARTRQLADDGFTQRVAARLPQRPVPGVLRLSRLWTLFCLIVAVALFVALDGFTLLLHALLAVASTPPSSQSLLALAVAVAVVGWLAVSDVLWRERLRVF